jgi:putative acetyltransferase
MTDISRSNDQTAALEIQDLLIRATRISDAEGIAALNNLPGVRAGTLRLPYQNPEQTRRWLESHGPASLSIVAEHDGRIIGSAGLHPYPGRRSHAAALGMAVRDDYQGKGVGTALLRALIDTADNWLGLRRIELTVYTDNDRAIRLYHRFGFETEGTHKGYALKAGVYADALVMARLRKLEAI